MPASKYDARNLVQHIAEGRHEQVMRERATFRQGDAPFPIFLRFVVLDVISDPATLDSAKLTHYEHDLGVGNIHYAAVAPRNAIIAQRVLDVSGGSSDKVMVLYPFFPPHLGMPAKPGEHVWGMFENPDAKVNEIGYWFCRIVQPNFVEDQNYTHSDRQFDASFVPGLSDVFEGTADPKYEFHNGAVAKDTTSGDRYVGGNTPSIPGDDKVYENLLKNADAAKIAQYESVPRYRKRPQDVAFEGTNNTLIVLGTDRTGAVTDYTDDPQQGKIPKPIDKDIAGGQAGAIDLVAGRGQTSDTGGKVETNSIGNKELGKAKPDLQDKEGDVDWINDRSRVLIAQKTKVDTNLDIDVVVTGHSTSAVISDDNGYGAIVVKTDKIRMVARKDLVILVSGATDKDDNGNVKDPADSIDPDKCASIILRTNGDIVFTPAKTGIVRLGGDDATLSPLCTRVGNSPGMAGPVPPPSPIVDTMGGAQGGADGLNGIFATKVLLK